MKTLIPFTLAAALAASGFSHAQTASSKPSGYSTQNLVPNQFNLVGLTLQNTSVAAGTFDVVSGNLLTDNQGSAIAVSGRTYVLEITSGSIAGTIQSLPASSITTTTVTTPDNLASMGLAIGDGYLIRLAPTLEEIFGVDANSSLQRSSITTTADIVWVPNGAGSYQKYFVHLATSAFRVANTTTPAPNIPVIYADGILVQKKGTPSSLTLTGEVKTKGTNSAITSGFNLVSVVSPVGATLFNVGLEDDIQVSAIPTTADIVWVPRSDGGYDKYFRHSSNNWRVVGTTINLTVDVPLPSAIFIQKKNSTPANISLTPPSSYSSL